MKTSLLFTASVFLCITFFLSPLKAEDHQPARPGTLNYVEGQVSLGTQSLDAKSVGTVELDPGETLTTQDGKAEFLLTPGVFVRLGERGSATMIASGLTDTRISIDEGEALVEVAEIHPENDLRILEDGKSTELLKVGLYDFNATLHVVRVLDGKAILDDGTRSIKVTGGHMLNLAMTEPIKARKFDKKILEAEDLFRWTSLRSGYLAEANADAAPNYSFGGFGWFGEGWYWDPWFDAYTFLPGDGIFYSPFGWGFYSPLCAYAIPFYGGHFYHHFNPISRAWGPQAHYGLPANYGRGVHYGARNGGGIFSGGFRGGALHGGGFHGGGGFQVVVDSMAQADFMAAVVDSMVGVEVAATRHLELPCTRTEMSLWPSKNAGTKSFRNSRRFSGD